MTPRANLEFPPSMTYESVCFSLIHCVPYVDPTNNRKERAKKQGISVLATASASASLWTNDYIDIFVHDGNWKIDVGKKEALHSDRGRKKNENLKIAAS